MKMNMYLHLAAVADRPLVRQAASFLIVSKPRSTYRLDEGLQRLHLPSILTQMPSRGLATRMSLTLHPLTARDMLVTSAAGEESSAMKLSQLVPGAGV